MIGDYNKACNEATNVKKERKGEERRGWYGEVKICFGGSARAGKKKLLEAIEEAENACIYGAAAGYYGNYI